MNVVPEAGVDKSLRSSERGLKFIHFDCYIHLIRRSVRRSVD